MVDSSENTEREDVSLLVTFDGDWPKEEREQAVEVVEQIEWNTSLPAPPKGWAPWHLKRISVANRPLYVAHRWRLETMPHAHSLEALFEKMNALAT